MKILWVSNFSSNSAYALQSHLYIPHLMACGHDVLVLELTLGRSRARSQYLRNPHAGMPGQPDTFEVKILPTGKDPFGSDVMLEHFKRGGFHAVISLVDPWGMNPEIMRQVPWFAFSPVDTMPVSPRNAAALSACKRPIALTRWGQEELRKANFDALYLPHGYDPNIWKPSDRNVARETLGIPPGIFFAAFVGMNDSLPSRKGLAELLFAWQIICHDHEDMLLYLHTDPQGNIPERGEYGGIDVAAQLKTLRLDTDPRVKLVDVHRYRTYSIPQSELALIANAADVLVLPGKGEGFGIPIIEFAATGTPSIVTNFGSMAELAGQMSGKLLPFEPDWGWQNAMTARPLVGAIAGALESAYQERHTAAGGARREAALQGAQAYNIDRVFMEYGIPVLDALAEAVLEAVR